MVKGILDALCNTWVGGILRRILVACELKVMSYYNEKDLMILLREIIYEDSPFLLKPSELSLVYSFARNQTHIDGDYAEVGVFKGATAKAICEAKDQKHLHLFDTFEGLPEVSTLDSKFRRNMFPADYLHVQEKLAQYPNVHIHKGVFPETGSVIPERRFAFVHLDVDIYQSTKDCLHFFYGRMSTNGILISHDYNAQGVRKAFDEFFMDKPEKIIHLPLSQCMIIKR